MTRRQFVIAPLGRATTIDPADGDSWLIAYSRKDFTPDQWRVISPANGPCVFRIVREEALRAVTG